MKTASKIAAGTFGGLVLLGGAAGVAGAATPHHSALGHLGRGEAAERLHTVATSGVLPAQFTCDKAARVQARITAVETRIDARISKGQAAEAAATAAGDSAKAARISARLSAAAQVKADLVTVSGLITAKCH